ncbi:DNA polymerase III subunit delta [Oceanicola sp. D3]|uniref:DNA polymerase III subunit delta n=1 Tax=Oceanicola sp. D3 TaxID=2587163 RepID=UPI00111F54EA|nr:DNA polymerase III subunit delta [Oceanicola sp. D3]QDC07802.1 DNA polymerase III subunit delta [Oceanicola sp. D3]
MKLSTRDANAFFAKPTPGPGILISGADAMRVALKRQDLLKALVGPNGEEEMRLSRLSGADLRSDPAALLDAVRGASFFPGPRAVHVEGATDGLTDVFATALSEWQEGDGMVVATAGSLKASSKLRKLFEKDPRARFVAIYDDPPSAAEIKDRLSAAGLANVEHAAMEALVALASHIDPGDLRQFIEKLSLYKLGDSAPLSEAEIAALAPATTEAGVDELLNAAAEAKRDQIGPLMQRLEGQGVNPTTLCIMAGMHFRTLHVAASDPGGPAQGIAKMRPPVFGPRRDRMIRQAQNWGLARLERALTLLLDTDLALRSAGQTAPQMAQVERAMIRLAMMPR